MSDGEYKLLQELRDEVIGLKRQSFIYSGLLEDMKLLKKVRDRQVSEALKGAFEILKQKMEEARIEYSWHKTRCLELGTIFYVSYVDVDERKEVVYSMDDLFLETSRTWRVAEAKRLKTIPRSKRTDTQEMALSILEAEILDDDLW